MKENFISFLLVILMTLIIGCIAILGINIYNDIIKKDSPVSMEEWLGGKINTISEKIDTEKETESSTSVDNEILSGIDSTTQSNANIQSNSEDYSNKYFYNQLGDVSKIIYTSLYNNKDNLKTGTYKVEFGDKFTDVLSQDNGQKTLGNYYQSAIEAFLYDNPDVFYLSATKMFLNVESTTYRNKKTYNVFINSGDNVNYLADGFYSKEQIENCENLIKSVENQILSKISGNTYEKTKKIHDILIANLEYDSTISKDNIYNIYGALVNRECVCEGYAKSYKYLLDKAGINSVLVIGKATNSEGKTENHSWNYVEIDGNWYAVDTTWDDPVVRGGGSVSSEARHKYFLNGYKTMNKDHMPNGQFTENGMIFNYPTLSTSDY